MLRLSVKDAVALENQSAPREVAGPLCPVWESDDLLLHWQGAGQEPSKVRCLPISHPDTPVVHKPAATHPRQRPVMDLGRPQMQNLRLCQTDVSFLLRVEQQVGVLSGNTLAFRPLVPWYSKQAELETKW